MGDIPRYENASEEPLDIIAANECIYENTLTTSRFRRLFNELADQRAALRDCEAATWMTALERFTQTMNDHCKGGAGVIELGCLDYDKWLRVNLLAAKAREGRDG